MNDSANATTDTLIERLRLAGDPFAGSGEGFFFVGGQRRFLVQQAVHALYFARGIVLLSGADGCGKTRVVDEVCRELAEIADICRIDASVLMDSNEIRHRLGETLGLAADSSYSEESLLAALDQLKPDEGDPLPVLLAVDDAQQLAVNVLADCHHLVVASQGRIRLLLSGAPELLTAWEQTGHIDVDQLDVLPLDAQETADYVSTCLQAAGYRGENPLDDEALDALYRQTRGNIAAINGLAPELLLDAVGGSGTQPSRRRLPLPHLAIVVTLAVIVIVAVIFLRSGGSVDSPAVEAPQGSTPAPASENSNRQAIPLPVPPATPAPQLQQPASSVPVAAEATVSESAPIPAIAQPLPAPPAAVEPVPPKPAAVPKVAEPSVKAPEPFASAADPAPKKAEQSKAVAQVSSATPAARPSTPAAKALADMPSNQFVVQLIAAFDKPKLDAFLAKAAKGVKVYTYETRRDGKRWYVAVTGPYASKEAGRAAIAAMPQALRDQKPWLRPVSSIKADLKAKK